MFLSQYFHLRKILIFVRWIVGMDDGSNHV